MTRPYAKISGIIILMISVSGFLFISRANLWYPTPLRLARPLTVAVIDELSAYVPDPEFNAQLTKLLGSVGYKVDYFGPEAVTVDFLRRLPSMGYGIVVLRNHSTGFAGDEISILTSEPYRSDKHVFEQLTGEVVRANLAVADADFFAVTPLFVRDSMQGFFPSSIVLMMGCTGLSNTEMAQAFLARGARVYVSWDQVVQAYRTDVAATIFWQWMTNGHSVKDASVAATKYAPADPLYHSQLEYYPVNAGPMTLS